MQDPLTYQMGQIKRRSMGLHSTVSALTVAAAEQNKNNVHHHLRDLKILVGAIEEIAVGLPDETAESEAA